MISNVTTTTKVQIKEPPVTPAAMDNLTMNSTINVTAVGAAEVKYTVIADAVLMLMVVLVIVYNLLVIAVLIADSDIVRSIRWILGNVLAASAIGALGSALLHMFRVVNVLTAGLGSYGVTVCRVSLSLIGFGNSGRVLMATFYAFTIFVVVRWWNKPVLAPRNTKYFIIAAVFVWLSVTTLVVLSLVTGVSVFCRMPTNEEQSYSGIYSLIPYFILSTLPIIFTLLLLIITVCFIRRRTITGNSAGRKALLRFGFFLVIGQGINAIGQIVCPAVFLALSTHRDRSLAAMTLTVILDLSLIPTPILVCILFKPVQLKLRNWFCCCCRRCSVEATATTRGTTQQIL